MLNPKMIIKLSILTIIAALIIFLVMLKSHVSQIPGKNKLLLEPLLHGQEINRIFIKDNDNSINIHKVDNKWSLVEKHNYPVLQDRVKELLTSLSSLKIVEPRTNNPDLYDHLGLGNDATVVELKNVQGKEIARIYIGNSDRDSTVVRLANDPQTWLVRTDLFVDTDFNDWVDEPLLTVIDPVQIKHVILSKAGKVFFSVKKVSPEQEDFEKLIANASDVDSINSVPFKIAELEFEDVIPKDKTNLDWGDSLAAEIETFNGIKLTLELVKSEDNSIYARVNADSLDSSNQELTEKIANYNAEKANWYYKISPELYDYLQSQ